jgi:hypothetical protein
MHARPLCFSPWGPLHVEMAAAWPKKTGPWSSRDHGGQREQHPHPELEVGRLARWPPQRRTAPRGFLRSL